MCPPPAWAPQMKPSLAPLSGRTVTATPRLHATARWSRAQALMHTRAGVGELSRHNRMNGPADDWRLSQNTEDGETSTGVWRRGPAGAQGGGVAWLAGSLGAQSDRPPAQAGPAAPQRWPALARKQTRTVTVTVIVPAAPNNPPPTGQEPRVILPLAYDKGVPPPN